MAGDGAPLSIRRYKKGDPSKDCNWVSRATFRGMAIGEDDSFAYQACREHTQRRKCHPETRGLVSPDIPHFRVLLLLHPSPPPPPGAASFTCEPGIGPACADDPTWTKDGDPTKGALSEAAFPWSRSWSPSEPLFCSSASARYSSCEMLRTPTGEMSSVLSARGNCE